MRPRPAAAAIAAIATLIAAWAVGDYRRWRALGVGGLPPTWRGWVRTTRWRMMMADPLALAPLRAQWGSADDIDTLSRLPTRAGGRPRIGPHPVPHRQLTDHAPASVRERLAAAFDEAVARDPARVRWALSHFELHNRAITLHEECCSHADALATHGEVAHIHPADGSMHMVLSASDAAHVVERGWGERHGLAGVALGLPLTYTLIYAPRDAGEVDVDAAILDSAIAYMAGADQRYATRV